MSNRCGVARATATAWMTVVGAFVSTLVTTGAAQASLIWDGNASKGTGVFGNLNCDSPSTLTAVSDPAGVHGTVWRYHKPATETRCENHGIAVNGTRYEFSNGSTYYFGWWSRLTNTSDNNANFQWKSYGSWCCQNFPVWLGHMRGGSSTFFYHKPAPSCSNGGCITEWSMPISPNVWNHYVLRLHLSDVDGQGTMQLWFNGVQQTFDTGSQTLAGRTWDAPGFNEPKWGVYGGSGVDMTNYVAGMKVGTAFADVAPAGSTPTPTPTPTPSPTATPTATPTTPRPTPTPTATATSTTPPTDVEVTPAAGSVTASTNDGNLPGNVVDNNLGTRWSAIGDPQWIKLDLGSARIVTRARIAVFNGNTRQNRFDLQVGDNSGGPWTNVLTNALTTGTTTALEIVDFTDANARYLRYVGHMSTASTFNSLTEVQIWGSACTSCPTPTATSTPTPTPITPTPTPTATPTPPTGGFRHPGVINTRESLDFIKARIAAGAQPQTAAFGELMAHPLASLSRNPAPRSVVECGAYSNPNNGCTEERDDAAAAYAQALLWYFTGNTARAQKAIQYMDAWSAVITDHTEHNARLQTGWAGSNWTKAAEIIRHTGAGWSTTGISRFRTMLLNVYYPELQNGAPGGVNGNWELTMIDAIAGIGVFCDDRAKFDKAIAMWRARTPSYIYITTDGSRPKNPPGGTSSDGFWYNPGSFVEGLGQETCRDLGHLTFGFAPMLYTAETALIQGIDLYTEQSRRIRAGLEYNARIQNGWSGDGICGGSINRNMSETLELGYNHYVIRKGFSMPHTLQFIQSKRPTNRGHHIVWETMTHGDVGAVGVQ